MEAKQQLVSTRQAMEAESFKTVFLKSVLQDFHEVTETICVYHETQLETGVQEGRPHAF